MAWTRRRRAASGRALPGRGSMRARGRAIRPVRGLRTRGCCSHDRRWNAPGDRAPTELREAKEPRIPAPGPAGPPGGPSSRGRNRVHCRPGGLRRRSSPTRGRCRPNWRPPCRVHWPRPRRGWGSFRGHPRTCRGSCRRSFRRRAPGPSPCRRKPCPRRSYCSCPNARPSSSCGSLRPKSLNPGFARVWRRASARRWESLAALRPVLRVPGLLGSDDLRGAMIPRPTWRRTRRRTPSAPRRRDCRRRPRLVRPGRPWPERRPGPSRAGLRRQSPRRLQPCSRRRRCALSGSLEWDCPERPASPARERSRQGQARGRPECRGARTRCCEPCPASRRPARSIWRVVGAGSVAAWSAPLR
jgi:hypothetical protein